jgi:hypothetical protein
MPSKIFRYMTSDPYLSTLQVQIPIWVFGFLNVRNLPRPAVLLGSQSNPEIMH